MPAIASLPPSIATPFTLRSFLAHTFQRSEWARLTSWRDLRLVAGLTVRHARYLVFGIVWLTAATTYAQLSSTPFDMDGDGQCIGTTDALMIARYLRGVRGEPIVANALPAQSSVTSAAVSDRLKILVQNRVLDINADDTTDSNDAILLIRYLLGLRGSMLVSGVQHSNRSASEIAAYIRSQCVAARLTLNGSSMLASDGSPVFLRGMNEGTWGEMQQKDATEIASNGANVIRVVLRWWGLYGDSSIDSWDVSPLAPGHLNPANLAQFLKEVQWIINAGLWVVPVLDSNCGQSGVQSNDMYIYCNRDLTTPFPLPEGRNFWTDTTQRRLFKETWIHLASILKNYPNIAFYELLPEPLSDRGTDYVNDVSDFYKELMTAIEDVAGDKSTPFLVGPRDRYNILLADEAYISDPRWANRVVYTGDLFMRTQDTQANNLQNFEDRLAALATMQSNRAVPVFIQSFGVKSGGDPGEFYLNYGLSRMNTLRIPYAGWQWRQNTTNADEYAVILKDTNGNDVPKDAVLAAYSTHWREQLLPRTRTKVGQSNASAPAQRWTE
jgi:aryl-phospho-beta-D-glucosidase BglC (GH1 family)